MDKVSGMPRQQCMQSVNHANCGQEAAEGHFMLLQWLWLQQQQLGIVAGPSDILQQWPPRFPILYSFRFICCHCTFTIFTISSGVSCGPGPTFITAISLLCLSLIQPLLRLCVWYGHFAAARQNSLRLQEPYDTQPYDIVGLSYLSCWGDAC